ncbi:MAG: methylmalonyl Co-A mutase-associated GTPase MeaB, partial [Betaproteobacteria bacterium]|nr:methylmalonyl Co-A mutase-associated GTPase MeaB [Betaproteobacteria bacterium]
NKADGPLEAAAGRAAADYRNAVHYLRPRSRNWQVEVETCSALEGRGIDKLWRAAERFGEVMGASGELQARRAEQARKWLWSEAAENLFSILKENSSIRRQMQDLESQVSAGRKSARVAADELIESFWQGARKS